MPTRLTGIGIGAGGPTLLCGCHHGLGGQVGVGCLGSCQLGQLVVPHMWQVCTSSMVNFERLPGVKSIIDKLVPLNFR